MDTQTKVVRLLALAALCCALGTVMAVVSVRSAIHSWRGEPTWPR
jgi:hypothetical protein